MADFGVIYGNGANGWVDAVLESFINEAVSLEMNVSRLYALFQDYFPEDGELWQTLSIEEENHALLLRLARKHFVSAGIFPREILPESVDSLKEMNRELERLIEAFELEPPERVEAFRLAVTIEESAGEIHLQRAMAAAQGSEAIRILQTLNNDDRDHADRLRRYMEERGIGGAP
ncbi:hypothetical protein [Geobacter sp.]|uniref:hypothetical protein n=1 Tax=Geobacter sp. TaxID=46610 RepID=UPI00260EA60E|nr:hypothetical protein [Geobacter sp.]